MIVFKAEAKRSSKYIVYFYNIYEYMTTYNIYTIYDNIYQTPANSNNLYQKPFPSNAVQLLL